MIIGHQVGYMDAATQRELVRHENGGEVALPTELVEAAREYARASHAKRTQASYARAWESFEAWCAKRQLQALPAAPETVAVWLTALADGDDTRKALVRSSINQALSAVIMRHRDAGYAFDRKHASISRVWKGICNTKARKETVRKAKPLLTDDLRVLIDGLDQQSALGARDAALLTLGWAGALRRSELVSIDWQKLGAGGGFVCIDERGIVVMLMASKASQDLAESIVVPRQHMAKACEALEAWAAFARLNACEPVFRPIDRHQNIAAERLTDRSVARVVKDRVKALVKQRGRSEEEADELVKLISGHSLRAGYATAAAANNMPAYSIQSHTRHKSAEVVAGYIREADKWTKSGLYGVGF
jgi:integrase